MLKRKKETKVKTEKASKSQSKILDNRTAKIDDLYAYQVLWKSFEYQKYID